MEAHELLRKMLDPSRGADRVAWHDRQLLVARYLVNGFRGRFREQDLVLPDPEDLIDETVTRILEVHSSRYVWDGTDPPDFDKFFARCMSTTINSAYSNGRSQRKKIAALFREARTVAPRPAELNAGVEDTFTLKDSGPVLAATIATANLGSPMRAYLARLPHHAALKSTLAEIAADLNVKPETVHSYRKRLRKLLDPDEK